MTCHFTTDEKTGEVSVSCTFGPANSAQADERLARKYKDNECAEHTPWGSGPCRCKRRCTPCNMEYTDLENHVYLYHSNMIVRVR